MRLTKETIEASYAELSDDELTELYKTGELTNEARAILINVMGRRSIQAPTESEVTSFQSERAATSSKKKAATFSFILLAAMLFLYRFGGYETIRSSILEGLFPQKAVQDYLEKGLRFGETRNHAKAIEYFQRAKAINPKDHLVYEALGGAYMGLGRFSDAASFYNRASVLDPSSGGAYMGLAAAYNLMGDYDKALLYGEKAISLLQKAGDERSCKKMKALLQQTHLDIKNAPARNH